MDILIEENCIENIVS